MKQPNNALREDVQEIAALVPVIAVDMRVAALLHPEERELGAAQLIAIILLDDAPDSGLPVGQLAERLGIAIPAATGVADRLEKGGHVERLRDPNDRRVVLLCLTEKGREAVRRLRVTLESVVATALEGLEPTAREDLIAAVHEVATFSARLRRRGQVE